MRLTHGQLTCPCVITPTLDALGLIPAKVGLIIRKFPSNQFDELFGATYFFRGHPSINAYHLLIEILLGRIKIWHLVYFFQSVVKFLVDPIEQFVHQ